MTRAELLASLAKHKADIDAFGVATLSVFGSFARDAQCDNSDIDLLVRFRGPATFDKFMGLKLYLEDLFGRKIDLVTDAALRPELREHIEREALRVA